jgi:CRISPR/Cas system CMR subunit Cmr4 (Cas7 group RAMP superfamily)
MPTRVDLVQLTYTLTFTTLFHCGTGVRTGLIDRSVIRDNAGYLYIPGSTLKGNVRERCEQLARIFDPTGGQEGAGPEGRIASPHDGEAALQGLGHEYPSMVTCIFGSQAVPGRLFFDNACFSEEEKARYVRQSQNRETRDRQAGRHDYKALQVHTYTQVRLNRRTRTAVPGALYSSEFGTNDLTFTGSIQGWLECVAIEADGLQQERHPGEMPTYSLLLLLAGLHMVEHLGGNKSGGKGQCKCELQTLRLNHHQIMSERWRSWLDYLPELAYYYDAGRTSA